VADFQQRIVVTASTSPAERALDRLSSKLDKIEAAARNVLQPVQLRLDTARAQQQIRALESALDRITALRTVRVRVIEEREVRASDRALPQAGRTSGGGGGDGAFLAAAALASSNAAKQIAAAANVQTAAVTSSAKAQTVDITATQVHARAISQATEALVGFRRQLTSALSGVGAQPAMAAVTRAPRRSAAAASTATGDQVAAAQRRSAAAEAIRETQASAALVRQLSSVRESLSRDTPWNKWTAGMTAFKQATTGAAEELKTADSNAQMLLKQLQSMGKTGATVVQSLYTLSAGILSAFTDAGRAAANFAADLAPAAGHLNEALNVTANLSQILRRATDTTSRMETHVEKMRTAIAGLVPYSQGTEKAVARLLELEKRLSDVKARQVQQYRDATAAARAQGDAVRRNVNASAASRAGSGFADFSRTAPGNADLAAWVRRNEGRITKGFRQSDDKAITSLLEQLELDRASQLETQLGDRTTQLLRRSATKFEADLADFDKRLEAAVNKRAGRARRREGIVTGIGAGLATANLPGQNIAQAALAGGALGGPAGAAAGAASGAVAALAAYSTTAATTSRNITSLEVRLRSLSQGFDNYQRVQQAAIASGERFGQGLGESLTGFSQLYGRLRPLGLTLEEIKTVYDGFSTSAKLAGASSAESAGALLQLSQALGAGALRGEEFNSVMEQAPGVALALARELNVPVGKLKEMAKEGELTSDVVVKALARAAREGGPRLAGSLQAPEQKFKDLANAVEKLNKAIGDLLLPAFVQTVSKLATATEKAATFVNNLGDAWFYVNQQLKPVVELYDRLSKNPLAQLTQNAAGFVAENTGPAVIYRGLDALRNGIFNWAEDAATKGKAQRKRQFIGPAAPQWYGPAPQAVPKPLRERLGLSGDGTTTTKAGAKASNKGVEEAVRRGVIGGMTGGGQGDASRGRSTGPHLHAQLVRGGSLERLVDQALDFGGGRTASSFGLGRGAAAHGYPGRDYYTPQGTGFTLRPGYSAQDLGIRGALGRGLRVSGPGGAFELGHLAGVKMGDLNGKGAAGDLLDAQQDALNAAVQAEIDLAEKRAESLKTGQGLTTELGRQVKLLEASGESARRLLQIESDYQDRKAQIAELLDSGQRSQLDELNGRIRSLEVLKEEVSVLYEKLDAQQLLSQTYRNGAGAFRTDINLDPNIKLSPVAEKVAELRTQLGDTEGQIVRMANTLESELGSAMGNAITGLVQGTQTAQQAFQQMFAGIGASFIQMATEMIAKALVLKALGILGGGTSTSLFSGGGPVAFPSAVGFNPAAFKPGFSFAGGGYTGPGARAGGLDGKGGFMAMLHPQETVIDHTRISGGGGAGDTNTNISISVNNDGSATTSADDANRFAAVMQQVAIATIQKEQRPGGSLNRRR